MYILVSIYPCFIFILEIHYDHLIQEGVLFKAWHGLMILVCYIVMIEKYLPIVAPLMVPLTSIWETCLHIIRLIWTFSIKNDPCHCCFTAQCFKSFFALWWVKFREFQRLQKCFISAPAELTNLKCIDHFAFKCTRWNNICDIACLDNLRWS